MARFFSRLSPQDIRYRFFTAMRELSAEQMARLTQIDYDREMAFIARARGDRRDRRCRARWCARTSAKAEFAVIVQGDMKGRGVARHLMQRLIDWARGRGLRAVVGQVLADNAPMLAFVRRLGFTRETHAGGTGRGGGAAVAGVGWRQWKRPPCASLPPSCARHDGMRSFSFSVPRRPSRSVPRW